MTRIIPGLLLSLVLGTSYSSDLTMLIGDNPPFNSFRESRPEGLAVQIVDVMLQRSGLSVRYAEYPWSRAQKLAQTEPGHCVYTLSRLPERENAYEWIGPIAVNPWTFFALRERRIKLKGLDDARQYTIAGQRNDGKAIWLESQGFVLDYAAKESQGLKKVASGRLDLFPGGALQPAGAGRASRSRPRPLRTPADVSPHRVLHCLQQKYRPRKAAALAAGAVRHEGRQEFRAPHCTRYGRVGRTRARKTLSRIVVPPGTWRRGLRA
ncbi:substrate-binding periplasmic protein [Chitinilyticum litopenaei]|uniref:substrate-binding periplasmic protein n=1 Tax=Chitinilyticum litopenaei TaxID=1121276 RepID=UPI001184FCEF|nr:transporter substrate-binding domain-containing protein [Chitinilyticum litopenaei]